MVEVDYQVFSAEPRPVTVLATLDDGSKVPARVEGLHVQLVPTDPEAHGTIALLLTGGDAERARELFVAGQPIKARFSKE